MSFVEKLKAIACAAEDLLFANHSCICCGREIPDGSVHCLCKNCYDALEPIGDTVCGKCGSRLFENRPICDECDGRGYVFNSNRSAYSYTGTASGIIKNFKYGEMAYIAPIVAEMMLKELDLANYDYITFVPISKKRRRMRGFNQAELIASEISKLSGITLISLLKKDEGKANQAGLKRVDRLENLKGSFHLDREAAKSVKNKRVLIIDDVFTTGTTLNECSKEILKAKPSGVDTMTFAKTMQFGNFRENSSDVVI